MTKQRRNHSAPFKFKVALEAAKELKTMGQLSSEYGIHSNQIGQWKKQLLEQGPSIFSRKGVDGIKREEALQSDLFEQIGRLKMELEWLKKKAS